MVKRLREMKLVRYERADGLALTPSGTKVALEILRHHRLLEVYLKEALGYTWDRVDQEAEKLEHVISEEFEDRIDELLGHPTHDPHGAPIPTKDGRVANADFPALAEEFEGYEIYRAGEEVPFQVGRTDARGRAVFLPDRAGTWRVKAFSEDGHGADFSFTTGADGGAGDLHQPFFERHLRIIIGVSLIFGVFGLVDLLIRRRGRR